MKKENYVLAAIIGVILLFLGLCIFLPSGPPAALDGPGWQMISVEEHANRNDTYITYGNQSKVWSDAVTAGWLYNVAYSYDGTAYRYAFDFYPNEGYWIKQKVGPLRFSVQPAVLFCGRLWLNGTGLVECTKLIISDHYSNIIQCQTLHVVDMEWQYHNIGTLEGD